LWLINNISVDNDSDSDDDSDGDDDGDDSRHHLFRDNNCCLALARNIFTPLHRLKKFYLV
jgi:hypothetical protein